MMLGQSLSLLFGASREIDKETSEPLDNILISGIIHEVLKVTFLFDKL